MKLSMYPRSVLGVVFMVAAVGCAASPDQNTPPGSGGTRAAGTGGAKSGSGGTTSTGSGGTKGSGGTTGSGGAASSGSGGSGSSSASCKPGKVPTGMLFSPYGAMPVDIQEGDGVVREYYLQVNEWNPAANMAPQTMAFGGSAFFKMTQQMGNVSVQMGPVGFPSHFIGANGGKMTVESNLPKAVSALTTVPTSWTWDDGGTLADSTNNSYNATYDVWFSTKPEGDPMSTTSPSGGFLMVWYHKPKDAQPIGSIKYSSISIPGVSGTWNVWVGMNGSVPCISYVSTTDIMSLSYDLNLFIQDAVKNRPQTIQSSWTLTNVFAGFEIWRGGVNLQSTSFCAVVN